MDWLGQSEFIDQTIYWSSLSSATSQVTSSVLAFCNLLFVFTPPWIFYLLARHPKYNRRQHHYSWNFTMLFGAILSGMCHTLFSLVITDTLVPYSPTHLKLLEFSNFISIKISHYSVAFSNEVPPNRWCFPRMQQCRYW